MPELPEIEAIRRYIAANQIIGRHFTSIEITYPDYIIKPKSDPEALADIALYTPIGKPRRRGKYLILPLNSTTQRFILLHMGMTGSLHIRTPSQPTLPYARATFRLDDQRRIELKDPRKWARLWCVNHISQAIPRLAPDPWDISPKQFAQRTQNRTSRIKTALLDQTLIAGVGNIYADEALHRAAISPLRRANRISQERLLNLHNAIIDTLQNAIDFIAENPSPDGSPYVVDAYDDRMKIQRSPQSECPRCRSKITSRTINARTAYYCTRCQR